MTGESTSVMVNGPSCLATNLGFGRDCLRFHPSSHTFAPFLKGWKPRQVRLFMDCLARSWTAKASFLITRRECKCYTRTHSARHGTHSARHGTLFPIPFRATLCRFSPNRLHCAVQARLCRKRCRHIIGLGLYRLSMMSSPLP